MPDMAEPKQQFVWILKAIRVAVVACMAVVAVAATISVAMIVVLIGEATVTAQWSAIAPYALVLLAGPVVVLAAVVAGGLAQVAIANEAAVSASAGQLGRIETLLIHQDDTLKELASLSSLTDQAKSLLYRDRELDAFREAIHHDLISQDYRAAETLIDTMGERFGYEGEAAALRDELAEAQKHTIDEKIDAAVARVEQIVADRDWPRAVRTAHRLVAAFPDHPKTTKLTELVETERTTHKRQLLQEYGQAVTRNDVNQSIELLKELDRHLTPQEAAALEESARGVFKAKLHNLGVQFAICVTDQRWDEAIVTGEEIVRGFPNSRMSHEVSQKMSQLRYRLSMEQAQAAAGN